MFFPKQYYVGIRSQSRLSEGDKFHLGFPTPDGTDAAAVKRKATVNTWTNRIEYEYDQETKRSVASKREGTFITIDNVPVDGFRLVGDVKRYGGWFSNGNVVWRVEDPRGFQFEISSANLGALLAVMTIEKGVIQGKCLYARDGARNALIAENTEEYQATLTSTNLRNAAAKFSLKNIKPGDDVVLADGTEVRYWGKVWVLKQESEYVGEQTTYQYGRSVGTGRPMYYAFSHKVVERYLLQTADNSFKTVSDPKVSGFTNKLEQLTPIENAEHACQKAVKTSSDGVVITTKKFTLGDIKYATRNLGRDQAFGFHTFSDGTRAISQKENGIVFCSQQDGSNVALPVSRLLYYRYNLQFNKNAPADLHAASDWTFVAVDRLADINRDYHLIPGYQRDMFVKVVPSQNGSLMAYNPQRTYTGGWEGIIKTDKELLNRFTEISKFIHEHDVWYQAVVEVHGVQYPYGWLP